MTMKKRHGPKHHGRGKKPPNGPHAKVPTATVFREDHHRNTKIASGGGMGMDRGNTTKQKGNRPIRPANKKGDRASTQKHGKFSHNTVI
jgi:hypothetical protein